MKKDRLKKFSVFVLAFFLWSIILPGVGLSAPAIPGFYGTVTPQLAPPAVNALPVLRDVVQGASVPGASNNRLVINQNQSKAIINWESFNIGEDASTHFDQQGNADWAALNRIFDQNPSQIFGALTSDGKIYLINQNGILFSPTSKVNVHSLTASSLNIKDDDFLNGLLKFKSEDYNSLADNFADVNTSVVSNHGVIETDESGSVFFLAPTVENSGAIKAPMGQIALAAGDEVELIALEAESRVFPFVYVTPGEHGDVTNLEGGQLIADAGMAGMYGRVVNQNGLISCVTAISNNGRIELHASEKVSTGTESQTITPISTDPERVHNSFKLQGGEIHVGGLDENVIILDKLRNRTTSTGRIEHYGDMAAPSGMVTMDAQERVYLETGSRVDVAGEWVERSADSLVVSVQLNSVELKNDYGQKGGILQGETVYVNSYDGSAIGDISGALNFEFLTAREMATKGGTISMSAPSGDIIVKEGAEIDFSGGGIRYSEGTTMKTTRLVADNGQVYDISEAPQWAHYDSILIGYTKLHERYGIAETFEGMYYGGASPLMDHIDGHVQGDDAGTLILEARGIVLDGSIYGWATRGLFQTETTELEEMFGDFGVQTTRGRREPRGGTLIIGENNPNLASLTSPDLFVDEAVITSEAPALPDDFGPDDSLKAVQINNERPYVSEYSDVEGPLYRTVLSSEKLNAAGLSDLSINVNTKVTVEENVALMLRPGGLRVDESVEYTSGRPLSYLDSAPASFIVRGRAIEDRGRIEMASGDMSMMLMSTITSPVGNNPPERQVLVNGRIYLDGNSRISVAGEKVDNTLAGALTELDHGHINAGSIHLFGDEVIMAPGAEIDVSSGYILNPDGEMAVGRAGTLELKGSTVIVEGDLRGYSLPDHPGGQITLHADALTVQKEAPDLPLGFEFDSDVPDDLQGRLVLAEGELDRTGFTHIALMSSRDLTIQEGVTLSPSCFKMTISTPVAKFGVVSPVRNFNLSGWGESGELITVPMDYIGSSSVSAQAGVPVGGGTVDKIMDTYAVKASEGSTVEVGPGGTIELSGLVLDLAGSLKAPAGDVELTVSGVSRDLTIQGTASILAAGCVMPERVPMAGGLPLGYDALDGGTVSLAAKEGNINVVSGAVIDVSGSKPVETLIWDSNIWDSNIWDSTMTIAGAAGSLELTYSGDLTLDGDLNGRAYMPSVHGGSLSITRQNKLSGLAINVAAVQDYQESGFDALAFTSLKELTFTGSMDVQLNRSLVLDAPLMSASGDEHINLRAPFITLANTRTKYGGESEEDSYRLLVADEQELHVGSGSLSLSGQWLDVIGSVGLSGFGEVTLDATGDMTLTDQPYYGRASDVAWRGQLRTPGDLVVRASRIYPTTLSDFTLKSDDGRITILPGGRRPDTPIVSAGGSLTVEALEIDHQGYLAAPMGQLRLLLDGDTGAPASRIRLGPDSVTSVACDSRVRYGDLEDIFWNISEKPKELTPKREVQPVPVDGLPERRLEIAGNQVIIQDGAVIDISGGGSVFSAEFLPGINGLVDPFQTTGRYVVVPGYSQPGEAVYLTGGGGLPAGTYALLPEEYAFLPGAYVIEDLRGPKETVVSEEGYPVVTGYAATMYTEFRSQESHEYAVRTAQEVFEEGNFNVGEIVSGGPGSLEIKGTTTILDGEIKASFLPGYEGGFVAIIGAQSAVVRASTSLPSGLSFDDPVPEEFLNQARIAAECLSGLGVSELRIGALDITETVTFEKDTVLEANAITLAGRDLITLEKNSEIHTVGPGGSVTLNSPDGEVIIQENALVHASDAVNLETSNLTLEGEMKVDDSRLNLQGANIFIVPDGYTRGEDDADGIYLTESLWGLTGFDNIGFISRNDFAFKGSIDLEVAEELTIDAKRIVGLDLDGKKTSNITSQTINLLNTTGDASGDAGLADTCLVTFNADDMTVGHGDILFDGFSDINLNSNSDLTFKGKGSLASSGDLNMNAARVTTSYYQDTEISYEVADFQVDAGNSAININKSGGIAKDTKIPGGSLEFHARTIDHSGIVDVTSGRVKFIATGSAADGDGIFLKNGSEILARGSDYAPGGRVVLQTDEGQLRLEAGSLVDVSAGGQGDAGTISLVAPKDDVIVAGTLTGEAQGGKGGSFALDTNQVNDFSGLNTKLTTGGFNEEVNIRTRSGDVVIAADDTVVAHKFNLTVDKTEGGNDGNINLLGEIDASGDEGGAVELYAGNDLTLHDGSIIDAHATGTDASGGEVFLNAADGTVNFNNGSSIDVSGGENGEGGKVSFRARRNDAGDDVKMNLNGTIAGASRVTAEAVEVYSDSSISYSDINNTWKPETQTFMNHAADIETRLLTNLALEGGTTADEFHLLPGIEIQSEGDLTLASTWDMSPHSWGFPTGYWWRYGADDEPGVLTLRAAGNLNLNESLVDHPTRLELLNDELTALPDSWGMNLVAGADLGSADIMATRPGAGDFSIGSEQLVYTENASIRFASGGDTTIEKPPGWFTHKYMVNYGMEYSLATFNGAIQGIVGGDLTVDQNGAIQSATGDINITVGGDLHIGLSAAMGSAIRTTGTAPPNMDMGGMDWIYPEAHDGGDITLDVGGEIRVEEIPFYNDPSSQGLSTPHLFYWDNMYEVPSADSQWSADYGETCAATPTATGGVATMGGGSVTVHTGGDLFCQIGTFKEGDVKIFANGSADGFFQVADGEGVITAMGNIKSTDPDTYDTSLALFDAQVAVTAHGNAEFGTVFNPTFVATYAEYSSRTPPSRYLDYGEDASAKLTAVTGDLSLSGVFWKEGRVEERLSEEEKKAQRVLPPNLELTAGGNIQIGSERGGYFVLAPSETGNLCLRSGGTVSGLYETSEGKLAQATLRLSDLDPTDVFRKKGLDYNLVDDLFADETKEVTHATKPLHQGDPNPVIVVASEDIRELRLITPKMTTVEAGGDIVGLYYFGQNIDPADMSSIKAGGDIRLSSATKATFRFTGLRSGGPGLFLVQAGGSMDLGTSQGIQAVGSSFYSALSEEDSVLAVVAGLHKDMAADEMSKFFEALKEHGVEYSELLAEGDVDGAAEAVREAEETVITPFFQDGGQEGDGDINMTSSSINTSAELSAIYIISAGDVNVGLTTIPDPSEGGSGTEQETGLFTSKGGGIGVFAFGDLNVNESRVMTFRGGDIIVWSDQGNINAGRGSKTAINVGSPKVESILDEEGNVISKRIVWEPPSVGSGIRTLTYDPDGSLGPLEAPEAGDAYLFAPEGVIDAGEAGISAKNVILGATAVLNAQNIEVTGVSVGVPVASDGASGLGALAGAGNLTETSGLTDDVAGLDTGEDVAEGYSEPEAFIPTWLKVKVVGFDEEEEEEEEDDDDDT